MTKWQHTQNREEKYQQREQKRMEKWKAGLSQLSTEEEKIEYFNSIVNTELDILDERNDRKHFRDEYRHPFDPHDLDERIAVSDDETIYVPPDILRLCWQDWDDYIFSKCPDDIQELVTDRALIFILKELKPNRKEILYLRVICKETTQEIAKAKNISDRYIRKVYEETVDMIRNKITPIIRFKRKLEKNEQYKEIVLVRNISTTSEERAFIEKMGEKYDGYYD